jgi:hypothetical protein
MPQVRSRVLVLAASLVAVLAPGWAAHGQTNMVPLSCQTDLDCSATTGLVCLNAVCVNASGAFQCVRDAECPHSGSVCLNGVCTAGVAPAVTCGVSADCPAFPAETCVRNLCQPSTVATPSVPATHASMQVAPVSGEAQAAAAATVEPRGFHDEEAETGCTVAGSLGAAGGAARPERRGVGTTGGALLLLSVLVGLGIRGRARRRVTRCPAAGRPPQRPRRRAYRR